MGYKFKFFSPGKYESIPRYLTERRGIALVVKTSDTPLNSGGGGGELYFFVLFCFRTYRT